MVQFVATLIFLSPNAFGGDPLPKTLKLCSEELISGFTVRMQGITPQRVHADRIKALELDKDVLAVLHDNPHEFIFSNLSPRIREFAPGTYVNRHTLDQIHQMAQELYVLIEFMRQLADISGEVTPAKLSYLAMEIPTILEEIRKRRRYSPIFTMAPLNNLYARAFLDSLIDAGKVPVYVSSWIRDHARIMSVLGVPEIDEYNRLVAHLVDIAPAPAEPRFETEDL